ncbi:MAG: hypothetical protein LBP52_09375 [Burkholderiaceae bacterium]|jgi:hypothetical protein|nr:hypothetical protein [Burkholderiaceae bacterium]
MALSEEHLRSASEVVAAAASLCDAVALWRARHPDVRAMVVDALDMRDEAPALRVSARSVYLAATDGHCWRVTQRLQEASALILTQED